MTAHIGIVAHRDRLTTARALAETVGAAVISVDDGRLGCEGNHYRTWATLCDMDDSPWTVVLEDDAVPVVNFRPQLDAMLAAAPAPIVSLYLGRERPPSYQAWAAEATAQADRENTCYIRGSRLLHGVGVAIHRRLVASMVTTARNIDRPVDEAITAWARLNHYHVAYCWPSLVDHRDLPTLVAHHDGKPRDKPRVAWRTGTRNHWHWRPQL